MIAKTFWAQLLVIVCLFLGVGVCLLDTAHSQSCKLPPLSSSSSLQFKSLKNYIDSTTPRTVDEITPFLKGQKYNWILLYESLSPEKNLVSDITPRVILFNEDATFILAYTDCSDLKLKMKPYSECEGIQTASFENDELVFREIRLPGGVVDGRSHLPARYSNKKDSDVYSQQSCTQCHASSNGGEAFKSSSKSWFFDPYNSWRFTYGSVSRNMRDVMKVGSGEYKGYLKFLHRVWSEPQQHKRYTDLVWARKPNPNQLLEIKKYNEESKIVPSFPPTHKGSAVDVVARTVHGGIDSAYPGMSELTFSPNDRFTSLLSHMNGRRILNTLLEAKTFNRLKFSMARWTFCGQKIKFPSGLDREYRSFEYKVKNFTNSRDRLFRLDIAKTNPVSGGAYEVLETDFQKGSPVVGSILPILFIGMKIGVDIKNWSTSYLRTYNFLTSTYEDFFPVPFDKYFKTCEPELSKQSCETLTKLSDEELEHF